MGLIWWIYYRCSDEINPRKKPYKYTVEKLKSLGMEFTPIKQCIYETVKSLQDKGHLLLPSQLQHWSYSHGFTLVYNSKHVFFWCSENSLGVKKEKIIYIPEFDCNLKVLLYSTHWFLLICNLEKQKAGQNHDKKGWKC